MNISNNKFVCIKCKCERKISAGRVCENGHFICSGCKTDSIIYFEYELINCPSCNNKLMVPDEYMYQNIVKLYT